MSIFIDNAIHMTTLHLNTSCSTNTQVICMWTYNAKIHYQEKHAAVLYLVDIITTNNLLIISSVNRGDGTYFQEHDTPCGKLRGLRVVKFSSQRGQNLNCHTTMCTFLQGWNKGSFTTSWFSGVEHRRSIAPSTQRVGTTDAASTVHQLTA